MLSYWPIACAYLLGAIPAGLIVARAFGIKDIRKHGSGNIGATNVWRVIGAKAAVLVYIFDIGKAAGAVLVAKAYAPTTFNLDLFLVIAAVVVVLGNVFPVFLGFKGGKGVNSSLGTLLVLLPVEIGLSLIVFAIVLTLFRYISLGSICAALAMVIILLVEKFVFHQPLAPIYLYLSFALATLVIYSHRQNIKRLLNRTESRFSLSSKTSKAGSNV